MRINSPRIAKIVALLATITWIAMPLVGQAKGLTQADLKSLITLGIDESAIVSKIQSGGVEFDVNDKALATLKSAGASAAVLDAVRKAAAPSPKARPPITYEDVVKLLKLHIDEQTILNRLTKSPTIFTLDAQQVAELKSEGASQRLLEALAGKRAGSSPTTDVTDFAIILDCSGSMKEKTRDGISKIDSAKRVVTELIQKIPDGLRLSFIVYASERKQTKEESCADIKIVRPLVELDARGKSDLAGTIRGLDAVGLTPIAASLKVAGEELRKSDGFSGIVLISDGKESCGGDPAAEAAELAKNPKLSFGVNVIGLDVRDDERQSLERIAEKGKGKYFNAESAAKLEEAVAAVRKELEAKTKSVPESRASRQTKLGGKNAKPGPFLNQAGLVEPGEYKGKLAIMDSHYYRIPVRTGQELRVVGQVKKGSYTASNNFVEQAFIITIYDPSWTQVSQQEVKVENNPIGLQTVRATWTANASGMAYIAISASDNLPGINRFSGSLLYPSKDRIEPSSYTLRVRRGGGAEGLEAATGPESATREPGHGFSEAVELAPPAMVGADLKLAEVGFYRVKVAKGNLLTVNLAVQKPWYRASNNKIEATYTLTVYDDDQVQVVAKKMPIKYVPPEARTMSVSWPVTLSGNAFISIAGENSGEAIYPKDFDPKPGYIALQVSTAANAADGDRAKAADSKAK